MKPVILQDLAFLRAVVGYLGEREQYNWWPCSFFGPGSSAFLSPVFGRTAVLAQLTAVTNAAARLHDEYIGVGNTWHLFRLPEDLEQDIHAFFADSTRKQALGELTRSREAALAHLHNATRSAQSGIGPTYVGDLDALRSAAAWQTAAAHYTNAFDQGARTYPYFADRTA